MIGCWSLRRITILMLRSLIGQILFISVSMYKSRVFSFKYLYIQALIPPIILSWNFPWSLGPLIGCLGTPAPVQPWALQLLLGSLTVQTCCALCVKIHIFYICTTLILQNAYLWLPLAFQVQYFIFGIIGSGLQGVPVTICCWFIDILINLFHL